MKNLAFHTVASPDERWLCLPILITAPQLYISIWKVGWMYFLNLGMKGFAPKISPQAIEGTYIDKKCPFTGNVSIRGRILTGIVASLKMKRTIIIKRDYLHHIKKYNRFEKRHKNLAAHLSPCFR